MNLSQKCKLYVEAGLIYEAGEAYLISDETYDVLSRQLLKNYEKLPKWFRSKITEGNLETGSAAEFSEKFG